EGYQLEAFSANFLRTGAVYFSSAADVAESTLTVAGLTNNVSYALRAGAVNWDGVINYTSLGNRTTPAGPPVNNPMIYAVYQTSVIAQWATVPSVTGYDDEASTDSNFNGTIFSTVTADVTAGQLTVGTVS